MRTLRPLFLASVLILALTSTAFAGEMTTGITPPSASSQGEMQNGVAGDMHTGSSEAGAAGDSVAADVLGLVLGALSLL
jgi:hypothetical protein